MRASICKFLNVKVGLWLIEQLDSATNRRLNFTNSIHRVNGQLVWEICANGRCMTLPIDAKQAEEIIEKLNNRLFLGNNVVMKIREVEYNGTLSFVGQLSW